MVAAVARNGMIGAGNALPWRLPGDLRHFKAVTLGKPVLMGRRTHESIGRPLPGRPTVVVSRDPAFAPGGVTVVRSIPEALAEGDAIARAIGAPEVMVAGGGELYAALIAEADRLYLTHVDSEPAGDTVFPTVDPASWRRVSESVPEPPDGSSPGYIFVTYQRAQGGAADRA